MQQLANQISKHLILKLHHQILYIIFHAITMKIKEV
jgi:hypothetical protein